jgi:hypothetical protein
MKYTTKQIAAAAELACFYVTPGGLWLRMQWTDFDEGSFCALDDGSGEDYMFSFAEMVEQGEDPEFHELVRMKVEGTESDVWSEP